MAEPPSPQRRILDCPCGERIVGVDENDLVRKASEHLAAEHPARAYTREQILFMAF